MTKTRTMMPDTDALDRIALQLDGQEWTPNTCDEIAQILRAQGYVIRDTADPALPDAPLLAKAPQMRAFLQWFVRHHAHAAVDPIYTKLEEARGILAEIDPQDPVAPLPSTGVPPRGTGE